MLGVGAGVDVESINCTKEFTQIESLTTNFAMGGVVSVMVFVVSATQPTSVITL